MRILSLVGWAIFFRYFFLFFHLLIMQTKANEPQEHFLLADIGMCNVVRCVDYAYMHLSKSVLVLGFSKQDQRANMKTWNNTYLHIASWIYASAKCMQYCLYKLVLVVLSCHANPFFCPVLVVAARYPHTKHGMNVCQNECTRSKEWKVVADSFEFTEAERQRRTLYLWCDSYWK